MPMAARPSSSARATSSRGCEAPRRKEKFVATASSAYALIQTHSRKQTVHEPARRRGLAAKEAFAVEPEAAPDGVLDQVVIARGPHPTLPRKRGRGREGAAPPFGADAFRPLRAGDLVGHAAPGKPPRRAVGDERHDVLSRLGARQEQQRAWLLALPCRGRADAERQLGIRVGPCTSPPWLAALAGPSPCREGFRNWR